MNTDTSNNPASRYEKSVLVLQGGGALGAYQAGAYQALEAANIPVDWVAGISIGAINAAIIAGNPPEKRVQQLEAFWHTITYAFNPLSSANPGDYLRLFQNRNSALTSLLWGVYGFFRPRVPPPWVQPRGSKSAISFYDTSQLKETLESLIDFDRINHGDVRLSLDAVNVRTGNRVHFDSSKCTLTPEHVMASAALPPGLPAIRIDDEYFWDGGVVSNTPLFYVLKESPEQDTVIFQIDLFSAHGDVPQDIYEVEERRKDILYSSRTRLSTDHFREKHKLKRALIALRKRLPEDLKCDPEIGEICALGEGDEYEVTIVHVIYKGKHYESCSKDYEFSRLSMRQHWQAGFEDTQKTIRCPEWKKPSGTREGIRIVDMTPDTA